jgi:hypothetical protein
LVALITGKLSHTFDDLAAELTRRERIAAAVHERDAQRNRQFPEHWFGWYDQLAVSLDLDCPGFKFTNDVVLK